MQAHARNEADRSVRAARPQLPPRPAAANAPVRLTEAGLHRLEEELRELEEERLPDVAELIREVRETDPDVMESGEYAQAMDELALLQTRAAEVRAMIGSGEVVHIPRARSGEVQVGTRVTLDEDSRRETFTIVGSAEADALEGRVSEESPLGRSLIGHRAGDEVEWQSPAGANRARILAVRRA